MLKKNILTIILVTIICSFLFSEIKTNLKGIHFTVNDADNFAEIALKCIEREYPNKLSHVMNTKAEVLSPKELHPAFYGCFDWHSSVHGHWMLIRLLKLFPGLKNQNRIRNAIKRNLTKVNIDQEVSYLGQKSRKSFERTYGWAWLLKLVEELKGWNDKDGKIWEQNLRPLEENIVKRYLDFLPKQVYPIRTGVHPNTSFGLSFALDYAKKVRNKELEKLIIDKAKEYFINDRNCPAEWEPGGEDFFSPCLMEADLMSKVLNNKEFESWLHGFILNNKGKIPMQLQKTARVIDRSDGKLVHLDGLNLSRAWCFKRIANKIINNNPLKIKIKELALIHAQIGLKNIKSGNYAGEHWLASFAVFLLTY